VLRDIADGVALSVWVHPGRSRCQVRGERDGDLVVDVGAPAVDGKANTMLLRFLADVLGVKLNQIRLVSGATHRRKRLEVAGLDMDLAMERLAAKG
jgi:hypothetical protein